MSDKKRKYEVTSPIKRNGKEYDIEDTIKLTEEEAEGLHVKPAKKGKEADKGDEFDASKGSHGNNADPAIEYIETADEEDLEGFLDPEEEGRVTVLRAWDDRFDTNLAEE